MIRATVAFTSCHSICSIRTRYCTVFGQLPVLAFGLLLLAVSGFARATCTTNNYHTGTVSFPSAAVTLPNGSYPGLVLWTSLPTSVVNPVQGSCSGSTSNGLQNQLAGQPGPGDNTLFPTGIAGLSYRILFTGSNNFTNTPLGVRAYPNQPYATGTVTFDGTAQLQLVITDPIAFGGSNPPTISGFIAQWNVDGCIYGFICGTGSVIDFNASGITFVAPACTIAVDPTVVTLPTVYNSAFTGVGSTAGLTPFNVQLNCPSAAAGANVAITLATSNPAPSTTGVIAPTSGGGYAKNVGVQVLDKNGNPIPFSTTIPAGTATAGIFNIPLNARYYQTGTPVAAGNVSATATYTITYQ